MREIYVADAIREALTEAMTEDPTVLVLGEDVERSTIGLAVTELGRDEDRVEGLELAGEPCRPDRLVRRVAVREGVQRPPITCE